MSARVSPDENQANVRVLFAIFLTHFVGDFYIAFVTPLFPALAQKLSLTLTQIGFLAGVSRLLAFIIQPTVGYIADHYHTRFFILGGPIITALFTPLLGVAPNYPILVFCVAMGAVGSALLHPTAAGMVSAYAGRHIGLGMAVFSLGGTMAFGLGPLVATTFVALYGLEKLPYLMVFGLAVTAWLFFVVPKPQSEGLKSRSFLGSIKEALGDAWPYVAIIWFLIVVRAFVSQSFMTFSPIMFSQAGYSLVEIGVVVASYTVAGAIGGLVAGHISDKIGPKPVFYAAYLISTPFLYLFLNLHGLWVQAAAFMSGFFFLATMPVAVAMAQTLAPKGRSMVASLMMGLAFGTGGMLAPITGKLAELYSIKTVLSVVLWVPLLALPLVYILPGPAKVAEIAQGHKRA